MLRSSSGPANTVAEFSDSCRMKDLHPCKVKNYEHQVICVVACESAWKVFAKIMAANPLQERYSGREAAVATPTGVAEA